MPVEPDLPLRLIVPPFIGVVLGSWRNWRESQKAQGSLNEAARLWGERLREQDRREDALLELAKRQVRLGWLTLFAAVASVLVAATSLVIALAA